MPKNEDEARVFRAAMADVRPLRSRRVPVEPPRPRATVRGGGLPEAPSAPALQDAREDEIGDGEGYLVHARPGVQTRVLRRLKRGQYSVEARLDLHGHTRDEARAAVVAFLHRQRRRGARCVCIVHGKGYRSAQGRAVIKHHLAAWLRQLEEVTAFCSALPRDGGTGALYVLLKG